ncbi:MAG TPA: hypothetical protein VMW42_07860 [Desulfatiglandales bacterium]|nr:hypothetical protein [Desulfatiglandales bacterium]
MDYIEIKDKEKINGIIYHLISKNTEISAEIKGTDKRFTTRVVKLDDRGLVRKVIIEKIYPEAGNSIMQTSPDVIFSFEFGGKKGVFETKYFGVNTQYPEFGLIVGIPAVIKMENKRREERIENGLTKFFSVEFAVEGDAKLYKLKVVNLGAHGVGLIVDGNNIDLLEKVNVGDAITEMRFFLKAATLTTDGIVRHKTQIKSGKLKGIYILGIQSDFIVDLKELKDKLKKEM